MPQHRWADQLAAARHAMHRVRAHQYAVAVIRGELTVPQAKQRYVEAMRNYDAIVEQAEHGHSVEANTAAMERGHDAIDDMLKEAGWS